MSHLKAGAFLLVFGFAACGRQVVDFGDTGAGTGGVAAGGAGMGGMVVGGAGKGGMAVGGAGGMAHAEAGEAGMAGAGLGEAGKGGAGIGEAGTGGAGIGEAGMGGEAGMAGIGARPTILSTTPLDLATGVSINAQPSVTFSTAMDPTTITNLTFSVKQGLNDVAGVVTLDPLTNTATFAPLQPLGVGLLYTATVSTGAKALGGSALAAAHSWSFTTSACSQATIVLGAASNFAVLAGSTVTSAGLTTIVGDLGVSPGTAITGFPPGIIVGLVHAGDPTSAQGIADLTTAYNDAAGRTLCPVTVSGNLGGQTLTPGLYKSTSSLAVSSGDLTLDAQGDGKAVFIFQMASTLTTTSGRQVILSNGALAANVYWQVGTSATLGTTSAFQGTIMADQAITLDTNATLEGRALARIAAVNLADNAIVRPLP